MIKSLLLWLAFAKPTLAAHSCTTDMLATVYEAEAITPQNMDFDKANNMFVAHEGWLNDHQIHYYKFMLFAPSTYSGVVTSGGTSADVPIQNIYIVTTDGSFKGAVGRPIVQYHHVDGVDYSDFMEVNFVAAPGNYTADDYKSEEDIIDSMATVIPSGIIINIPVVPTGSTLQDPEKKGTAKAAIDPILVWYKCQEIWTYVFEVTDSTAAEHFEATRTSQDAPGMAITTNKFATSTNVLSIPIWHVNQFKRGVTAGVNGGGPDPAGMKNIINLDRPDPSYTPLWQIFWAMELPINYLADEASNNNAVTSANGFNFFMAPMYVNCPDIGPVGTTKNPDIAESYDVNINLAKARNWILGSTGPFQEGVSVSFKAGEVVIGIVETNMMGTYEFELGSSLVPRGTSELLVVAKNETIRTIIVVATDSSSAGGGIPLVTVVGSIALVCFMAAL